MRTFFYIYFLAFSYFRLAFVPVIAVILKDLPFSVLTFFYCLFTCRYFNGLFYQELIFVASRESACRDFEKKCFIVFLFEVELFFLLELSLCYCHCCEKVVRLSEGHTNIWGEYKTPDGLNTVASSLTSFPFRP